MKTLAETGDFLQNIILDVPDVLTSGISGSVIVHLDQSFSQNALSHYGIVSLEIVLILAPSINLNPH